MKTLLSLIPEFHNRAEKPLICILEPLSGIPMSVREKKCNVPPVSVNTRPWALSVHGLVVMM